MCWIHTPIWRNCHPNDTNVPNHSLYPYSVPLISNNYPLKFSVHRFTLFFYVFLSVLFVNGIVSLLLFWLFIAIFRNTIGFWTMISCPSVCWTCLFLVRVLLFLRTVNINIMSSAGRDVLLFLSSSGCIWSLSPDKLPGLNFKHNAEKKWGYFCLVLKLR